MMNTYGVSFLDVLILLFPAQMKLLCRTMIENRHSIEGTTWDNIISYMIYVMAYDKKARIKV